MTSTSRRRVIAVAALLAAIPALAACGAGFDANTNQPYAPTEAAVLIEDTGSGLSYGKNGVKIPQAFVLGPDSGDQIPAGGSAPLYLTMVNSTSTADALTAVVADQQQATQVSMPTEIALPPDTLTKTPGVTVVGLKQPLRGGETMKLTLQFKVAGAIELAVPVITRSREFASLPPAVQPSATPTAGVPTDLPSPAATSEATGAPETTSAPEATSTPAA